MNIAELRKRGWSDDELDRAIKIFAHAERQKHPHLKIAEHVVFWTVLLALFVGIMAFIIEITPLLVMSNPFFSTLLLFIMGVGFGLLLVHVIHDLKLERAHHHIGTGILIVASVASVAILVQFLESRIGTFVAGSAALSTIIGLGIALPYLIHWRMTRETA